MKKLIEVAIPLDVINAASAREKSIRHGHPSTLHLWWARRPLATARAVLFASLIDDPSEHADKFPTPQAQDAERKRRNKKTRRIETARTILDMRGTVPRRWRNMLLFMAAEAEKLRVLKDIVRDFMAWREVSASTRSLNLDSLQIDDAKSNLKLAEENFAMKLSQAYCKIFVPERSTDGDLNRPMEVADIDCTKENNISAASEKFSNDDNLIGSLGPDNLTAQMNKFLWCDDDSVVPQEFNCAPMALALEMSGVPVTKSVHKTGGHATGPDYPDCVLDWLKTF